MKINSVIIKPILTEKSMAQNEEDKYHFKVSQDASKSAIRKAVEELFDVTVEDVKTMVIPGKRKRVIGTFRFTKTKKWKKAVVKVQKGQKIKLVEETK